MKRLIVALVASVAVSAAFAKIVDTQGFETDRSAFVSDGQEGEDESFLDTYGTRPGFAAPYNFTDLGETAALQYGDKFLSLDTGDATVWRTNEFEAAYFDMAMQFNPSTSAPTLEDGTKIAVYLNSSSNLVIMAGPKDGDLPTEYVTTNTLAPEAWARLTISAINDTQFQAHLNGVIVGTSAGQDTFASLTGETAVKSVGFKGTGALDDFVARSTDPFIVDPVAKIGEEGYATLAAAMGDATNGVTVVLQKESNENVELPEAGVVFNTNGQTYNGQVSAASGLGWTVDNGVYTADNNSASMWTNESGDNMWTTADNWSNHAVPGTTTVVTFNNDATVYTGTLNANCAGVTLNGNLTIARDAVLSSYTRLVIYGNGNITGSGKTLTLRRAGIWSVSTCVIDSNLEFYNATPVYATAGEDCFLENGVFTINGTVSGSGLFKLLTRSVTFNGAVTLDNGTISSINATTGGVPTFNAAVTLTNSSLITTYAVSYGGPVSLGDDARISIGSANQTYGENFSLSGSGRVIFDTQNAGAAMQTQLQKTDGTWTGVCELKNISFGSGSVNPNVYANSNSSLCFNGVTAGILTGPSGTTYGMDIELLGNGLTLNGTLSGNNDFVFSGALEGAGALTLSTTSGRSTLRFSGDTSGFTGNITATGSGRVAFGADQAGSAPLIYVHTGATVTVADGATWATGTVSVNGNLTVNGTIENTLAATINNGATATVASGATWTAGSGFGVVGTFDVHGTIARSGGNSIVLYGDNTTGEVKFYDASTALKTNSIASNWRATYVVGWSPSSAFNPNEYGYANSVVAFAEDFSSGGYFGTGVDEPFVIQPTVRIDASRIFIQGGFVKADDSSLVTFTQLAGSGKFCSYGTSSAGLYAYYRINTLKEFSGSFEINQHANCAIGNIVLESSPVAGTRVIPMKVSAFSAAINSPAYTVADSAETGYLVYADIDGTDNNKGLYLATAQSDGTNYISIAAAIAAGKTSVTLLADSDEDFVLPAGGSLQIVKGGFDYTGTPTTAEGYRVSYDEATGTYTSTEIVYVAQVGETKYETLKAAVDAATAGQTVAVIADCTVNEAITFNYGITVSNDYTVTLSADYALRMANGTATPVTVCGTGTFLWAAAGSPFLVGCNEAKTSYGVPGTFSGSMVLDSGTVMRNDGNGNLIKVENGSFVMNGGLLLNGSHGVKADADAGSFTSTVVINGGVISNSFAAAIGYSAESATGTAEVTVNGGQITGIIQYGAKTTGTATLTIPGTSTAQFDRNQTAFCEAGYGTKQSGDWYVVARLYTITFISGEGSTTSNIFVFAGDAVTPPTAAEVVGKTFDSWTPAVVTTAAADATYTAVYTVNNYTVTVGGGQNMTLAVTTNGVDAGTSAGNYAAKYGDAVRVVYTADTGYNIAGESSYTTNLTVTASVEITAPTASATEFSITYYNADGTAFTAWKEGATVPNSFTVASAVALPDASCISNELLGVTFEGWTNVVNGLTVTTTQGLTADLSVAAVVTVPGPATPTVADTDTVEGATAEAATAAAVAAIVRPTEVETKVNAETYATYFSTSTPVQNTETGKWEVKISIADSVQNAAETSAVTALTTSANTVTVPAGLYYKITYSSGLPISGDSVKGLSEGSVDVSTLKPSSGTAGFFKVELGAAAID